MADDAGWNDVGYQGSEIHTPHIDGLAAKGVVLDQFYVCPTCSPTRASLLTGRPPSRFGILSPIGGKSKQALPKDGIILPKLLGEHGYDTALIGKWHLGLRPEVGPNEYGFQYTYGYLHGQIDQFSHEYKFGDQSWHKNGEFVDVEGHATDLIANETMRYIKESWNREKPFFIDVCFSVPHYPLQEEDKWIDPYKESIENESRRVFAASMTHMDDAIGQILQTLKDENLEEDTLVIFISDNGGQDEWIPAKNQYEGRHGPYDRLGDNTPLRDWKNSLYEGGIRVPAIVAWPGRLRPDKITQLTSVADILPTVAFLGNAEEDLTEEVEGRNIWSVLKNHDKLSPRDLYWRTHNQMALRHGDWKLLHHGSNPDDAVNELYNLKEDPFEKKDVAEQYPEIVEKLFQRLKEQASKDRLEPIAPYE